MESVTTLALAVIAVTGASVALYKAGSVSYRIVKQIDDIWHQLRPNGGTSLFDRVTRIERRLDEAA